jgi:dipeptide/tripeptide permease
MTVVRRAVFPLRVLLVALFVILLGLQTLSLPGQFAYMARESPDFAPLRWPMTALAVFWVLCAQVVVVCTWQLLTLVDRDRIFSDVATRWVDGIVWAIAAGWMVLAAVTALVTLRADDPGVPVVLALLSTAVAVAGLVVVVLRALLRQATALRADLEAVI